ncbi:MarR family winged helix-turn-helix transcriptional regulator [Kitasatospora sp. NPDC004615]|uniref:MarR family winged helix-turn-helix transcriptional regulator n=1 Tax=Kitasatospora sp. NPDC004615 TaxID=3364017 RepID=UPI0036CF4F8A
MQPSRDQLLSELADAGREFSNAAVMHHAAVSELLGLSTAEEKTLDLVRRDAPLTAGDLAARTGLAPATVTGLVERLERKGFIQRSRDAKDRRRVLLETVPGLEVVLAPLFAPFAAGVAELHHQYPDAELATILDFLRRAAGLQREATSGLVADFQPEATDGLATDAQPGAADVQPEAADVRPGAAGGLAEEN